MSQPLYELRGTGDGIVARVGLRGNAVLASPILNRGTAFTAAEREQLGLTGLLPDRVSTIEGQLQRVYGQFLAQPDDLAKNLYLANLRDSKLVDWSKQSFIQTGYSSPRVGQVFTIGKELNEPFEGRLFFAGEHTQMDHFGYMEGAIRSGERAARMLLDHACLMFTEPPRLAVAGGSGAAPSG